MTTPAPVFLSDQHLRIGEDDFNCDYRWDCDEPVPDGFIGVQKERPQVERYLRLTSRLKADVIVELGIRRGGGSALLHALLRPSLLIGIELSTTPGADLSAYITRHRLDGVIKPHYGVDQADRIAVPNIMNRELSGRPIDLVVDDASHLLDPTRASFDMLFPMVRPGGLYILEDWNWDHLLADGVEAILSDPSHPRHAEVVGAVRANVASKNDVRDPRLVRIALELVLARAGNHDVIREVTVMNNWLVVERGNEAIDASTFRLARYATDHFKNLR